MTGCNRFPGSTVALAVMTLALAGSPLPARAQDAPSEPAITLGPVRLLPRLEIKEVGIDDNVFNDAENPQEDFTATITPRLTLEMRFGSAQLTYGTFVDFVYYRTFSDERSINRGAEARVGLVEGLLRPFVVGSLVDTRERFNAEIDARASRRQTMYGGGLGVALTSRTILTASARRATRDFAADAIYRDVDLGRSLDVETDTYDGTLTVQLTPLTTWLVTASVDRDRFTQDSRRDADAQRLVTGFAFAPTALISGRAVIGYRRFDPIDETLADITGVVASAALVYSMESTRLEGLLEHDVRYSYEDRQPFYLLTSVRLTLTQQIAGPLDVQGTVGHQRFSYRDESAEESTRADSFNVYGGGIGFRLGEHARLGFNVEQSQRRSDERPDRRYDRRRIYGSLSYGF